MTMPIWIVFLYGGGFISFLIFPKQIAEGALFDLEFTMQGIILSVIFLITLFLIYKFVDSKYEIKRKSSSWRDLN